MADFYDKEKRDLLKAKSAFILPANPSNKGFSADQIRRTLYEPSLYLFDLLKVRDTTIDGSLTDVEKQLAEHLGLINANKENIRLNGVDIKLNEEKINRLDNEAVKVVHQDLTEEQKKQARLNLDLNEAVTIKTTYNEFYNTINNLKTGGIYHIVSTDGETNSKCYIFIVETMYRGVGAIDVRQRYVDDDTLYTRTFTGKWSDWKRESISIDGRTQYIPYNLYYKGSIVYYDGESYIATEDTPFLPTDPHHFWLKLSSIIFDKDKGVANGVATLDSNGKIPNEQLPTNGAFHYKRQVPTKGDLPTTGNEIGDVYDVKEDGRNYVWNGTDWDDLGGEAFTKEWQDKINANERKANANETKISTNTTSIAGLDTRKQEKIVAGKNITIAEDGKTISATTDYSSIPLATKTQVGGIKANPATTTDTREVHIDNSGLLKVTTEPAGDKARVDGENLIFESAVDSDTLVFNERPKQPFLHPLTNIRFNNEEYVIQKTEQLYNFHGTVTEQGIINIPNKNYDKMLSSAGLIIYQIRFPSIISSDTCNVIVRPNGGVVEAIFNGYNTIYKVYLEFSSYNHVRLVYSKVITYEIVQGVSLQVYLGKPINLSEMVIDSATIIY